MSLSVSISHRLGGFSLDVAFEAPAGLTVLFGRSGSGKTTIVNAVAGLLRPQHGLIAVDGETLFDSARGIDRPVHRRRFGYVFQESRLFPHLSVRQNLLYGRWFAPRGERREEFGRVVEMLGLGGLLARRPGDLSGGERQRVALGRALLSSPRAILADEPLAALDDARKAEIMPYFERLRDEGGVPILYVSHSMTEVARLATTIVALREGRVLRAGPAASVLSDPHVAPELGLREAGALIAARVLAHHPDDLTELEAAGGRLFLPGRVARPGATLRVRIAARDVILSRARPEGLSALNVLAGVIGEIRVGEGPGAMVTLLCAGETVLARVTRRSVAALGLAPGVVCHAVVKSVAIARADVGAGPPAVSRE